MTPMQLAMTDATFRTIIMTVRHEAANQVALLTNDVNGAHRVQADAMDRLLTLLGECGYEVVKKAETRPSSNPFAVGREMATQWKEQEREEAEADAPTIIDKGRCPTCDWPYADSAKDGCVPGNCSMRGRT